MAKFLVKIFLFFVLLLMLAAYGGFWLKNNTEDFSVAALINVLHGRDKIRFNSQDKQNLREKAGETKNKVYEEATQHNPEGDVLPDGIDDEIKRQLKEEAKERID